MKATETSSNKPLLRIANYGSRPTFAAACVAALVGLASVLSLQATVLDNFAGAKTGWTDTLNGGTVVQSGGHFTIATYPAAGELTYSVKTATALPIIAGSALELKVNVPSVSPGSGDPSPLAIVGWVPSGGALLANGYSLSFGAQDFIIMKNGTPLFSTNFATVPLSFQNANITLSLRMTANNDGSATILGRVYKLVANGQATEFSLLFQQTVTDASGLTGEGYAALGAKDQATPAGVTVAFSLLQDLVTTSTTLDTFTGSSVNTTMWHIIAEGNSGDSVSESSSGLLCTAGHGALGGFAGVLFQLGVFPIAAGGQVEFQVDMVDDTQSAYGGVGSYPVLGYLPSLIPSYLATLTEYHIAYDYVNTDIIVSGKGYNCWWDYSDSIQPPVAPPGTRMTITMSGETNFAGSVNCRIETRIEDLSVADPNNPARLVYQAEAVDTTNFDAWNESGYLGPVPQPFVNVNGYLTISVFNADTTVGDGFVAAAVFQNAVVRKTVPPPTAPAISAVVPAYGSNFVSSGNVVAFTATDPNGNNIQTTKMSITLNGVTYNSASSGVTFSGSPGTVVTMTLAGALAANVNYVGSVQVTNSLGLASSYPLVFDTFLASDYVVESEDYNFSSDGGLTWGSYIDNPTLIPDGGYDSAHAYNGQFGMPEMDFHDSHGSTYATPGIGDANHSFRFDEVYNTDSIDPARAAYVTAGVPERELNGINDGNWLNYTYGNYPVGTFNVFLRQAAAIINPSLVTLARVTGATTSSQTAAILGTFAEPPTGLNTFINVPLTDGAGNPMVLRLAGGLDTFQIYDWVTGNASSDTGSLQQNYFVFVPVTIGTNLGPIVALATPLAGFTFNSIAPTVNATIANRDTSVSVGTIGMKINGSHVAATAYATNGGAFVTYTLPSPLPTPGSTVTSTVYYQDGASTWYTNTWTWTLAYNYLSTSLPLGSLTIRGIDARMVQSSAANIAGSGSSLDNSVASAKAVLAQPANYVVDVTSTNIVQSVSWGLNVGDGGSINLFPGLCAGPNVSFAVEAFTYLHLTAGSHTFNVVSDDHVGIYSGSSLKNDGITLIQDNNGDFSFIASAEGLYPFHIIYEQGQGAADCVLTCKDTGSPIAINQTGAPEAYYPFVVESATSPAGPWTADTAANAGNTLAQADVLCGGVGPTVADETMTGGQVIINPAAGAPKYYRIDGPRPTKITSFTKTRTTPSTVTIHYTGQ
jgi:hypothetical protein